MAKSTKSIADEALGLKNDKRNMNKHKALMQCAKDRNERADAVINASKSKMCNYELPTPSQVEEVCKRISLGQSPAAICLGRGMPSVDVLLVWIHPDLDVYDEEGKKTLLNFSKQYRLAVKRRLELEIFDLFDVADTAVSKEDAPAVKLRVETRQWCIERMRAEEFAKPSRTLQPPDIKPEALASSLESAVMLIEKRRNERLAAESVAQIEAPSRTLSISSESIESIESTEVVQQGSH